jgi:hypothetical protein
MNQAIVYVSRTPGEKIRFRPARIHIGRQTDLVRCPIPEQNRRDSNQNPEMKSSEDWTTRKNALRRAAMLFPRLIDWQNDRPRRSGLNFVDSPREVVCEDEIDGGKVNGQVGMGWTVVIPVRCAEDAFPGESVRP